MARLKTANEMLDEAKGLKRGTTAARRSRGARKAAATNKIERAGLKVAQTLGYNAETTGDLPLSKKRTKNPPKAKKKSLPKAKAKKKQPSASSKLLKRAVKTATLGPFAAVPDVAGGVTKAAGRFLNRSTAPEAPRVTEAAEVGTGKHSASQLEARKAALRAQQDYVSKLTPEQAAQNARTDRKGEPFRNFISGVGGDVATAIGPEGVKKLEKEVPKARKFLGQATEAVEDVAGGAGSLVAGAMQPTLDAKADAARTSKQAAMDALAAKPTPGAPAGGPAANSRFGGSLEALRGADAAQEDRFARGIASLRGSSQTDAAQKRGLRFLGLSHADQFAPGGKEDPMTERNRAMREARTMEDKEALRGQFRGEAIQDVRRGEDRAERENALGMNLMSTLKQAARGDAMKREEFANNIATATIEARGQIIADIMSVPDSSAEEKQASLKLTMDEIAKSQTGQDRQTPEAPVDAGMASSMDIDGDGTPGTPGDAARFKTAQDIMTMFANEKDPTKKARMQNHKSFIQAKAIMDRVKKKAAIDASTFKA